MKIKSRGIIGDRDFYLGNYQNLVHEALELIGIHITYMEDFSGNNIPFTTYYNQRTNTRLFHYNSKGERYIIRQLEESSLSGKKFFRRKLTKLCRSYPLSVVVFHSDMLPFYDKIFEYILQNSDLENIYCSRLSKHNGDCAACITEILEFQEEFLRTYHSESPTKVNFAKNSLNSLRNSVHTEFMAK